MKKQIVIIGGGDTFETYEEYLKFLRECKLDPSDFYKKGWKKRLADHLGDRFDVLSTQMPNNSNAKYLEWKIWFDKYVPYFKNNVTFVAHSLGGLFLAKYLSENDIPQKILATLLVSPPFDDTSGDYSLADFILPESLKKLEKQVGKIILYHSKDDQVVPFSALEQYKNALPKAETRIFEDRGHFNQEEFPELVQDILNLK